MTGRHGWGPAPGLCSEQHRATGAHFGLRADPLALHREAWSWPRATQQPEERHTRSSVPTLLPYLHGPLPCQEVLQVALALVAPQLLSSHQPCQEAGTTSPRPAK